MANDALNRGDNAGEVEILEFILGEQTFGVSVLKIEAIEQYDPGKVTTIPMAPPMVAGTWLSRGRTLPMLDLGVKLNVDSSLSRQGNEGETASTRVVLVTEFSGATMAMLADGVRRIHRVPWDQISPLAPILTESASEFTGSTHIEGREILIIDMEKIISEIIPEAVSDYTNEEELRHPRQEDRANVRIMMVEDSGTMRTLIRDVLVKGNYSNVTGFGDGKEAAAAIRVMTDRAERDDIPLSELVGMVITDIEMPQMDGLTLCKEIRQTLGLADLPIVVYSTLMNDQITKACKQAGANGWISKPQVVELVGMLDKLTLDQRVAELAGV